VSDFGHWKTGGSRSDGLVRPSDLLLYDDFGLWRDGPGTSRTVKESIAHDCECAQQSLSIPDGPGCRLAWLSIDRTKEGLLDDCSFKSAIAEPLMVC
jgi:hypothetical protein